MSDHDGRLGPPLDRALSALLPAVLFLAGLAGVHTLPSHGERALRAPLSELPAEVGDFALRQEMEISAGELAVLRPDAYALRRYADASDATFDLLVVWYGRQMGGATIHSPRNCLPGSGWEPVEHERVALGGRVATLAGPGEAEDRSGTVNRYVIESRSGQRALVYYWYQGRGRIAANEYLVKWDLLRDALLRRRSDEAMVRLVFPLASRDAPGPDVTRSTMSIVRKVSDALSRHLPEERPREG